MSDLYLQLRDRIPVVAERTHIGTARIQAAQKAAGLSNEAVARSIPISEKTWRRWKEAGSIPTASLPAAARALRMELVTLQESPEAQATVLERLDRIEQLLEKLLAQSGPDAQAEQG